MLDVAAPWAGWDSRARGHVHAYTADTHIYLCAAGGKSLQREQLASAGHGMMMMARENCWEQRTQR
jgi:hypothetical protein